MSTINLCLSQSEIFTILIALKMSDCEEAQTAMQHIFKQLGRNQRLALALNEPKIYKHWLSQSESQYLLQLVKEEGK